MVGQKAAVRNESTTEAEAMRAPPAPPLWRSGPAAFRPGDFRATRPGPCSSTNRAPPGEKNKEAPAQGPLGLSGRVSLCSLPGCAGGRGEGARGAGWLRGCSRSSCFASTSRRAAASYKIQGSGGSPHAAMAVGAVQVSTAPVEKPLLLPLEEGRRGKKTKTNKQKNNQPTNQKKKKTQKTAQ